MLHSQIYKSTAMPLHHNACAIDKRGERFGQLQAQFFSNHHFTLLDFTTIILYTQQELQYSQLLGDQMKCSTHIFQCARTECAWGRLLYKCWDRFVASFESPDLILYIFLFFGDKNMGQIDQKPFRFKKELRKFDKYS